MITPEPDITAVLNVHHEGPLAHNSLRSMLDARRVAESAGLVIEVMIVADCPDQRTTDYVASARSAADVRIVELEAGDLASARNAAVEASSGAFIAFLDGDDLWSDNWLLSAYREATHFRRHAVWHPECNLYFGETVEPYWFMHFDSDRPEARWTELALRNHWTALSFAERNIYRKIPYKENRIKAGFGFEDWAWNVDTIDAGFEHRVVSGTAHLLRVTAGSLLKQTTSAGALQTPVNLFRNRLRRTASASYTIHDGMAGHEGRGKLTDRAGMAPSAGGGSGLVATDREAAEWIMSSHPPEMPIVARPQTAASVRTKREERC